MSAHPTREVHDNPASPTPVFTASVREPIWARVRNTLAATEYRSREGTR
ncbi:hypothetical protein GS506_05780 [Rhodococcus hoagii]|nr:hypothetical protein [Prescottella equi]